MSGTNPVIRQNGFAKRDDSAGLNTSTGLTQNTNWSQAVDTTFRYRTLLSDTAGATKTANYTFGLQYSHNGGTFTAVSTTTPIKSVSSAQFNDDDATTSSVVTGTKAGTFVNGRGDENGAAPSTGNITLGANHTEIEWALQIDSAQVSHGDTIALRVPADTVTGATFATITVVEVANHAATGALAGPGSTVSGSASRTRVHPASGALTGPGAVVEGSAARTGQPVSHATDGALTGPGSTVAGSATRFRAHSTLGALAGQGSSLSGSAARFRAMLASGALAGAGSLLSGSASRTAAPVSHATSGALTGQIGSLSGAAARIGWDEVPPGDATWTPTGSTPCSWSSVGSSAASWSQVPSTPVTWDDT